MLARVGLLASNACAHSNGPFTKGDVSAWDEWAGVVTAALTSATDWAHGLQFSRSASSADGGAPRAAKQQQQQQRMQLCMQDAAFQLGEAARLLLLPSLSKETTDVPEWAPLPGLLMSLAGFCGISSEALEAFMQV